MKFAASLMILLTTSCAQNHQAAAPASPAAAPLTTAPASAAAPTSPADAQASWDPQAKADAPFLVHEAQPPAGFPPPGPIGQVILKYYPPCRAATVSATDVGAGSQNDMFHPLFNHIQHEKIAMTAPLQMDFDAVNAPPGTAPPAAKPPIAMSFLYANPQIGTPGKSGVVTVRDLPAVTVLSVGERGSYDADHFNDGIRRIYEWLANHPKTYRIVAPPRFLGYNSPFVPWFWRYGEVQIPVVPWCLSGTTRP
jgi:hypothetical protein